MLLSNQTFDTTCPFNCWGTVVTGRDVCQGNLLQLKRWLEIIARIRRHLKLSYILPCLHYQIRLLLQLVPKLLRDPLLVLMSARDFVNKSEFAAIQTLAQTYCEGQKTSKVTVHPRISVVSAKTCSAIVTDL